MVRSRSAWFVTATAALAMLGAVVNAQGADSSICTTVKCIANGDAECNRATSTCPTCMYTISGGYSCYDKIDGACPYPDLLMTCPPKAAATPAPTPKPTSAPVTESPATVAPPTIDTPPATIATPPATTAVSSATSPPATTTTTPSSASSDGGSATTGTQPNSVQNNPTSNSTETSGSSSSLRNGSGDGGPPTSAVRGTTSDSTSTGTPAPSPSAQAMDSSNGVASGTKKVSSLYVNIGVIVAAVAGIAIVAIFIVRRMKKRREEGFLKTPEESNKQFNLQVDGRPTPSNGGRGAGGAAAVGAGAGAGAAGFAVGGIAGGAHRGHRASSSNSDAPSLLSMTSLDSSTAEFANHHHPYGLPSQFGLPSDASSYARSTTSSQGSSTINSSTFGGYNHASARGASRPQAIQEDDEFTQHSKRKQSVGDAAVATAAVAAGGARTPGKNSSRPVHQPIYHETVRRKSSAISLTSGNTYEDEYDIVRPGALKDADRRNTETLVKDGRFQSNFSERDVQSIQQDRFFASKEHEI